MKIRNISNSVLVFIAWLISVVSTGGSLFFSEVMQFHPCVMCWYQRIFMYPLVFIFMVAFVKSDKRVYIYSLPLTFVGWLFSVYHLGLYFELIPETAAPCLEGVSCSTVYIQWLGFITIPMLSFFAFSALLVLQIFMRRNCDEK